MLPLGRCQVSIGSREDLAAGSGEHVHRIKRGVVVRRIANHLDGGKLDRKRVLRDIVGGAPIIVDHQRS